MLQLSGILSNVSVRITPRISWWITAHYMSLSSMAPNPDTVTESTKDKNNTNVSFKTKKKNFNTLNTKSLLTAVFQSLANPKKENVDNFKDINDKINSATNIDELLNVCCDENFNASNAPTVVYILYNWLISHKVKMSDFVQDERYIKLCKILKIEENVMSRLMSRDYQKTKQSQKKLNLNSEENKKSLQPIADIRSLIKELTQLAHSQKRNLVSLERIARLMVAADQEINIKLSADILYSISVLSFYNESLIKKLSQNLIKLIPESEHSAVIGSIIKSISLLRYRDEQLLESFSTWIVKNKSIVRPQEISNLIMTLAHLYYIPRNIDEINELIIKPLNESDMCKSSEWLDIVWALTILNQVDYKHFESVLNDSFVNRVNGSSELSIVNKLKLLNINTAARFLMPDYKGPLLPENSNVFNISVTKTKEKINLSECVISALKMLLPSDSTYLNINVDTKIGVILDAEFCVDSHCTPVPINSKNDKKVFRIGLLSCSYQEFCRGDNQFIGLVHLQKKLLETQGYKVLLIPYTHMNNNDKLVTRAQYIKDSINTLLQENSET